MSERHRFRGIKILYLKCAYDAICPRPITIVAVFSFSFQDEHEVRMCNILGEEECRPILITEPIPDVFGSPVVYDFATLA
jgi:hypothetical protein